ncbi:hypothetical protein CXB51_032163 [Gossypium anomalum]|uniref:Uncharacterized protein n=1 Tax=Gossypium anomalum TaxID=47600 RepID=A0A8J5Y5D5_9ROSI|nr:hypothetical protein CXB51_032163 [Gossypium anomalum]
MGPVTSSGLSATCEQLLGNVPNKFRGSWIEMGWLDDNFKDIKAFASDVEKEQFARAFILRLIRDLRIQECIPAEFLANYNIWQVKVPLIVYTTVEMHESDRVMQ